jgi:AraC family transcriptional regulator
MGENAVMISSYNNDPGTTPPEELLLDACITLPEDAEIEGEGEVKLRTLKGGKYVVASLELTGPQEYEVAWNAIVKWIQDNGHEMNTDRSWYEIYKNDPNTHPKKHHLLDMCAAIN